MSYKKFIPLITEDNLFITYVALVADSDLNRYSQKGKKIAKLVLQSEN